MSESEFELVEGSGNVFRDFAEPDADLKQAEAIVAARIIAVLDERALTVRKYATKPPTTGRTGERIGRGDRRPCGDTRPGAGPVEHPPSPVARNAP